MADEFVARMPDEMREEYQLLLEEVEREKSLLARLSDVARRVR
jgi:hypothetical protein